MEKFTDLMVKDTVTGQSLRADKLLEDIIDDLLAANPAMPTVNKRQNPSPDAAKTNFPSRFSRDKTSVLEAKIHFIQTLGRTS